MSIGKKIGFAWGYSFIAFFLLGYYFISPNWTFFVFVYAYILIPILDEIVSRDSQNASAEQYEQLIKDRYFDFLVYSHVYIQYFMLFWCCYILTHDSLTWYQIFGLMLSQGVYASTIINVAHELGHRASPVAQFHARAALISVCYMHFFVEHNRGHHVHVATPLDPATARKNQTVFAFWKQSLVGGFSSAWDIEQKRLQKNSKSKWDTQNEMIWAVVLPIALCVILTLIFRKSPNEIVWIVPFFFTIQSLIAILSLECVNYIEHYGILRQEIGNGRYERVNPLHSWNANHFYSNLMLFQLQRHSDHHAYAARPYQVLRHFDESPQLPFGYTMMILISLVPPIWFKVMNKRLEDWQKNSYDSEHIMKVVRQFS
ncbi:Alkane 1-monooxygenase [Emticicia aquatica]|uniref:Alkane 1-monooxygenase n=1 Tax=Emticicia aquatica TaxID=1681835 RepID=A0ABM9ARV1_9BACT|nr:alkane 1-monooxygenase [Emticicia aquatica]CAH0996694.1 Alkane 1-monooxygenase [Emticicia aquatica]